MSSISSGVGVSSNTILNWISILEASSIIYLLRPLYKNFGKRLIKSPENYFLDTGILCFLSGIHTTEALEKSALLGSYFETLVLGQLVRNFCNKGLLINLYSFRDSHRNEVDIQRKGGYAYVLYRKSGLIIFNEKDPGNIFFAGSYTVGTEMLEIALSSDTKIAYIAAGARGLLVLNVSRPELGPFLIEVNDTVGFVIGVELEGTTLSVKTRDRGTIMMDISLESPVFFSKTKLRILSEAHSNNLTVRVEENKFNTAGELPYFAIIEGGVSTAASEMYALMERVTESETSWRDFNDREDRGEILVV